VLTMKARYAIRALTALARHEAVGPMMTIDIARIENIPYRFLSGILVELRQHELLVSRRGRGGGYALRQPPEKITVAAVLTAIDGPIASEPCVSNGIRHSCKDCPSFEACGARLVLDRVYTATRAALERTTIAELAQQVPVLAEVDRCRPSQLPPGPRLISPPITPSKPRENVKHA